MIQLKLIETILFSTLFMFLSVHSIDGQQDKDISTNTVIVYETVVVYDTLHVFDTLKISRKYKPLPEMDLIPINPQIGDNNSDSDARKKQNLKDKDSRLTAYLKSEILTNKSGIEAKEKLEFSMIDRFWNSKKIGISAGTGTWWIVTPFEFDNSKNKFTSNFGLFMEGAIQEYVVLKFELNYSHLNPDRLIGLMSDDSYMVIDGTVDTLYQFNQISLPVKLCLSIYDFQVYGGLEYAYLLNNTNLKTSFCLGASYWFTNRLSLGFNYAMGINNPHTIAVYVKEDFTSNDFEQAYKGKGNSHMINFCLSIALNKPSNKKF